MKNELDNFEKYMGLIYSNIIKEYNLKEIKTVVEVAPGFKWKIANALKKINFDGEIYIVDLNEKVINFVKNKYQELLPNAKIIPVNKDLIKSIETLPSKIDLFVANHCIDDILISKKISGEELKEAFSNTKNSKEILINCCIELKKDKELLSSIKKDIINDFINFFSKVHFNLIILNHYKSVFYKDQGNIIEEMTKEIFENIKSLFTRNNNKIKKAIDFEYKNLDFVLNDNIQNEDNWIVGTFINKKTK